MEEAAPFVEVVPFDESPLAAALAAFSLDRKTFVQLLRTTSYAISGKLESILTLDAWPLMLKLVAYCYQVLICEAVSQIDSRLLAV